MQINAISNAKNNIQFQSKADLDKVEAFVNMSDAQLRQMVYSDSDRKEDKRAHRNIAATFLAMPIVDSIASGVLATEKIVTEAPLITPFGVSKAQIGLVVPAEMSTRLSRTATTAGGWAFAIGMIGIYSVIKHQIVKNSPSAQEFEQDHPVWSFARDLGLIVGACALGLFGIGKLAEKAGKKYPKSAKEINEKLENYFKKVDGGKFNRKTLPTWVEGFAKFQKEMPFLAKTGKFVLANSVWVLLGAAIVQMLTYGSRKQNKYEQKYQSLRTAQLETAKHLVRARDVERDILSQGQKGLTADLEAALDGDNAVSKNEIKQEKQDTQISEDVVSKPSQTSKRDSENEEIQEIQIIKIVRNPDKKANVKR